MEIQKREMIYYSDMIKTVILKLWIWNPPVGCEPVFGDSCTLYGTLVCELRVKQAVT